MRTRASRRLARLAGLLVLAAGCVVPGAGDPRGAAILERFTPDSGGFALNAAAPAVVSPNGKTMFVFAANRLLCSVDAATGEYVSSIDLGVSNSFAIASDPFAPLSISEDGSVVALAAAGTMRFYDVGRESLLSLRSERDAGGRIASVIGLSADGAIAVLAVESSPPSLVTVRTSDAKVLGTLLLGTGEVPLSVEYAAARKAISVVTTSGVAIARHDDKGKLKLTGLYPREGLAGDPYSGIQALGKRGRVVFTIEAGGSALIGLSLKGKQTARAPAKAPNRFSSPLRVSADGKTIVATLVNGQTGAPAGLAMYQGDARGIVKGEGSVVPVDSSLGAPSQIAFAPSGAYYFVTYPSSSTVAVVDVATKQVSATTTAAGSARGLSVAPDGLSVVVSGSASEAPLEPGGASGVTIVPTNGRNFDSESAVRFATLPGALFGAGDAAFVFPSRFFGVATSEAADSLYTFNASSGREIQRVALGRSTGFLAIAPDGQTLVVSSEGGIAVYRIDLEGMLSLVGEPAPGAAPDGRAPSVAFHSGLNRAFVTSGPDIWSVDLADGSADRFAVGGEGTTLTNPMIGSSGTRLYAIRNGHDLVRCSIDGLGNVAFVNVTALGLDLDPEAPRVAYDATGLRMWARRDNTVLQVNLLTTTVEYATPVTSSGLSTLLVATDLLAVVGDPVSFLRLGSGEPVLLSEVVVGESVHGAAGVDEIGRRVFVGAGDRVVAVSADGATLDIASGAYAQAVRFSSPPVQLAFPDVAEFPGSVIVARGF